jgi:hypothetical protein
MSFEELSQCAFRFFNNADAGKFNIAKDDLQT